MDEKDSLALLFQGICYIEPLYDKTKYLCALIQPLGTSIPEALAYHMNRSLEGVPKNITNLPQRIPNPASIRAVKPFHSKQEHLLLKRMLHDPQVYKANGKTSVFREDGSCNIGVLLVASSRGEYESLLDFEKLQFLWNVNVVIEGEVIKYFDYEIGKDDSKFIYGKEIVHFKIYLRAISKRSVRRFLDDDVLDVLESIRIIEDYETAEKLHIEDVNASKPQLKDIHVSAPPVISPNSDPKTVNHAIPSPVSVLVSSKKRKDDNTFEKESKKQKPQALPSKELIKAREVNRNCAQNAKACIEKLESM